MPSPAAVGRLATTSASRLTQAAQRLADATGVPLPELTVRKAANPAHRAAVTLEQIASWAESLADKIAPKATETPEPKEEDKSEPEAEVSSESQPAAPETPAEEAKQEDKPSDQEETDASVAHEVRNARGPGRPRKNQK